MQNEHKNENELAQPLRDLLDLIAGQSEISEWLPEDQEVWNKAVNALAKVTNQPWHGLGLELEKQFEVTVKESATYRYIIPAKDEEEAQYIAESSDDDHLKRVYGYKLIDSEWSVESVDSVHSDGDVDEYPFV